MSKLAGLMALTVASKLFDMDQMMGRGCQGGLLLHFRLTIPVGIRESEARIVAKLVYRSAVQGSK